MSKQIGMNPAPYQTGLRVFRSSLSGSSDVLWRLDGQRSHGEIVTSHPLWGHRSTKLTLIDGEVLEGDTQLDVTMRIADLITTHQHASDERSPSAGVPLTVIFQGNQIEAGDVFRFTVSGQLRLGDRSGPIRFNVHDLGWTEQPDSVRRWTLTASAAVDRKYWGCGASPGATGWLTWRFVDVFLHLECVVTQPFASGMGPIY